MADVVLFDLDGTLTDPGVGIGRSVAYALSALGRPALTDEQLRGFVGPPLQESFGEVGLSPSEVERAVAAYRECFIERGMYENAVYDGIPDLLGALAARGMLLAVATSKPTVYARRILEHFALGHFFDVVVGAELDGSRRHKAEIVAEVLVRLPSSGAVMVGDRAQDVAGAAANGLPCVGVAWGYAGDGELEAAGAACVATSPADLLEKLLGDVPTAPTTSAD